MGSFHAVPSLLSLMVAFCATVYLVFTDKRAYWILGLVVGSALVPVFMYAFS
ncbi:hypothetical protein Patl1_12110 [Pistacia atlantica]|uniref:Uncharacterized protein n=1 Tax=Pistacia atlantica TaxID=434234 RepID=A0ACC1A259_9ROSI|nr:hypothetical protein Patl1_12110 [Pistacia atlantica]